MNSVYSGDHVPRRIVHAVDSVFQGRREDPPGPSSSASTNSSALKEVIQIIFEGPVVV